ncbi:MAG: MFS transporter [Acidimicrobiales bacterium]
MHGTLSSLQVRGYPQVYLSGFLWNLTRWLGIFLGSYLVNERTGSPLLVQLVGTSFFLPMFVGGLVAGVVSDRFDRRRTLLNNLAVLAPLTMLMAVLVATDTWQTWMIFVFVFAVGIGGVLDMTNRRALVYDLVGPTHITNAVALEMFSTAVGNMLGFLTGGALLDLFGDSWAFVLMATCYVAAFITLFTVQVIPRTAGAPVTTSLTRSLADGARLVRTNHRLRSILGVTVLVNVFMFSFLPMIPVFAERLELGPFAAGLIGSAMGTGMMIGSFGVAASAHRHRGTMYVAGSFMAIACLIGLPLAPGLGLAYPAVLLAGIGGGMFGATQSALVMSVADDDTRGRAMGTLAMAIGGLPFGILALGVLAEGVGAPAALLSALSLGIVLLAGWVVTQPEVRHIQ